MVIASPYFLFALLYTHEANTSRKGELMSDEKLTKVEARERLLEMLTDEELAIFWMWIRTEYNTALPNIRKHKIRACLPHQIKIRRMFVYTLAILSGECQYDTPNVYQKVLSSITALKEKMNSSTYADEVYGKSDCTEVEKMPGVPMTTFNEHTGNVTVTVHAFERFCEIVYGNDTITTRESALEKLQELFRNSIPTDISPGHRVERIINNNFKKAGYFLHSAAKLRFVVRLEGQDPAIVTVERPK